MSIRLRLALWYTVFLAAMFVLFAPAVYLLLERQLVSEIDGWLAPLADRVVQTVSPAGDPSKLLSAQDADLEPFTSPGVFVELLDPNDRLIARSPSLAGRAISVPDDAFASAWWGHPAGFTTTMDGSRYRGVLTAVPGGSEPRGFVLAVRSLTEVDATLSTVRAFLLVGNVLGLLLAAGVGWLIARNGLRPIEEITQTARAIALSQGFGRRLKVGKARDEVGRLAVTFNEMLASLDAAFAAQRRFAADASHELRSPLTSIKGNIDYLRRALDAPREDRAEALEDVAAEVDRMSRLISDLLLLARGDAGHKIEMEKVALDELAKEAYRQMENRADGIALGLGEMPRTVVMGNGTWLKQLMLILLDNALKYTPKGGAVTLSLDQQGDQVDLRVRDTGIGIAPQDVPHIFERFYRADKARARDEGGAGLGLAIAQWIAEEHRGALSVQSEVGKGTTFTLRLPAAA